MTGEYDEMLAVARRAALAGGRILLAAFGRVQAREKAPGDLVTDADLDSQRAILDVLRAGFPDHTFLAEEEGVAPDPSADYRWIVDPLDGTINFAHGLPIWCVSIGLERRGELVAGLIHEPLTGRYHAACRGLGASIDGKPTHVSTSASLRTSLIACGMPVAFAADADRQLAMYGRMSTGTHSVRRTGSSAWNLAMVAAGAIDACYATGILPWDAAAGVALVREAGGVVTSIDGSPYDLYGPGGMLATNGHVHQEAVDRLAVPSPDGA